ncbi:unnamed protein product [Brassicogethes aeneus]|uniref:Etoposide-induced protein 2.4 n=1 Tax=Brassicogethes aeneus TaxID=1431903 RepID=A0A9P0BDN8_BRAAE|nr:unnamed protein product [Brassicogethes aeneus]
MDLKAIIYAFVKGFYDSLSGMITIFKLNKEINQKLRHSPSRQNVLIRQKSTSKETTPVRETKHEEDSILMKTMSCGCLNGAIFLASVLIFDYVILRVLKYWIGENNSFILLPRMLYNIMYLIPLYIVCKVINVVWFQDIADSAYKHVRGRPKYTKFSNLVADSVFSLLIQTLFLIQASLTSYLPIKYVGYTLSMIQMCMLYALYAFEYKWCNMGWELHRRLTFIENNWPYFIGFGLPQAVLTQLSDSWMISGGVFAVLFPFFIVSATGANPLVNSSDFSLHFFAPVIHISNAIFKHSVAAQTKPTNYNPPRSSTSTPTRR